MASARRWERFAGNSSFSEQERLSTGGEGARRAEGILRPMARRRRPSYGDDAADDDDDDGPRKGYLEEVNELATLELPISRVELLA